MDIVRHRRWFFLLSALLILPAIGALVTQPSLRPGIDFTGGTALTVEFGSSATLRFDRAVAVDDVSAAIDRSSLTGAVVRETNAQTYSLFIPLVALQPDEVDADGIVVSQGDVTRLSEALNALAPVAIEDLVEPGAGPISPTVIDRLDAIGHEDAIVQALDDRSFFIRVGEVAAEQRDADGNVVDAGGRAELEAALNSIAPVRIVGVDSVSALVGSENVFNAIIAVLVASVAILLYVTWAFRGVPSPFRYGTAAIVALIHDVIIVLGTFSYLGKLADIEVNAMFITGVLAVIGYSVNDTIVVFDRLRENVARYQGASLPELANISIRETIGRSLNTSLTLLIVVGALLLFGGPTIQPLLLVLLVGVIVGTYSSIFVATLMLVAWETGELGRVLGRMNPFGGRRRRTA